MSKSTIDHSQARGFRPRALGEIAIRCKDFHGMIAFYRDILGLIPFGDTTNPRVVFFQLGESHGGHTAVLALFRHDAPATGRTRSGSHSPETGPRSSLHHIALSLPWEEQDAVVKWYRANNMEHNVEHFDWVGWRGVFTFDPDGNTVELVAKNPNWTAATNPR
ncbi:VOC family protein [Aliiroseovarius sp. 2305UL8-7]|uniref:VOC family protein n=1 Tax=Aliiroseovarius conchicola TaxID=3121637 RepID=UPI003528DB8B